MCRSSPDLRPGLCDSPLRRAAPRPWPVLRRLDAGRPGRPMRLRPRHHCARAVQHRLCLGAGRHALGGSGHAGQLQGAAPLPVPAVSRRQHCRAGAEQEAGDHAGHLCGMRGRLLVCGPAGLHQLPPHLLRPYTPPGESTCVGWVAGNACCVCLLGGPDRLECPTRPFPSSPHSIDQRSPLV